MQTDATERSSTPPWPAEMTSVAWVMFDSVEDWGVLCRAVIEYVHTDRQTAFRDGNRTEPEPNRTSVVPEPEQNSNLELRTWFRR